MLYTKKIQKLNNSIKQIADRHIWIHPPYAYGSSMPGVTIPIVCVPVPCQIEIGCAILKYNPSEN